MRRFCKKTLLLMWKNWLQISRKPWWLVVEMAVPIVLFIVLAVMRKKYPSDYYAHREKLYRPMGLPSAGLLPFAQTLVCDLDASSSHETSDMPTFPDANVTKLYQLLGENGLLDSVNDDVCVALRNVESQFSCTRTTLQTLSQAGDVRFSSLLQDPSSFNHFLTSTLSINSSIADSIINATINTQKVQSPLLLSLLSGVLGGTGNRSTLNGVTLRLIVCNVQLLNQLVSFSGDVSADEVSRELCALSDNQLNMLASELRDQLPPGCGQQQQQQEVSALSDLLLLNRVLQLLPAGSFQQNGGEEMNMLYTIHKFLCGKLPLQGRSLLLLYARIINGDFFQQNAHIYNKTQNVDYIAPKILFTPNTPLTRSIIARANRTFATVEFVLKWTAQVRDCSDYFLTHYPPTSSDVKAINSAIQALLSLNTLPPGTHDTLVQSANMFNPYRPDNIWDVLARASIISQQVDYVLGRFHWDVFTPIKHEDEMEPLASNISAQLERNITTVFAGIVFDGNIYNSSYDGKLRNVSFAIRMNSTFTHDTNTLKEQIWTPGPENREWKRRYLDQGFIFLQDMIERAIMEEIVGGPVPTPGVYLHEMPYPCYERDLFVLTLMVMFPLLMSLAWIVTVAMTVRRVVQEKEAGLKEIMQMMQVSRGHLWFSWFLTSFVIVFMSVVVLTSILKWGKVLVYSDGLLLFLYLLLYATTVILYCFLCSVFYSNANTAAVVSAVFYFFLYFAEVGVVLKPLPLPILLVVCLMFPLPFALGNSFLVQLEVRQIGQHFSNLLVTPITGNPFNFALCCVMLLVDCVVYCVLIWYIEAVHPGKYGVSKPWYFPFLRSYWLGHRDQTHGCWSFLQCRRRRRREEPEVEMQGLIGEEMLDEEDNGLVVSESEPSNLTPGIQIQHLSKNYWSSCGRKVRALKGLTLNMYEDQITAFLGHNGAGKTTTMSLLTGLFEPSGGTALVYGMDVRKHMDSIRSSLGMCPQHNILFDDLSVAEHLMFYSQMKGLTRRQAKQQLPDWLCKVGMLNHKDKLAKQLSGGMKRKLSILLAFVGNSRTVILDEPTSGVDPYARKQIWEFLSDHRTGRTIMLSTHHMDEAEALGDRIAIISRGSLLCCGTFDFLKHHYGHGHHLTMVKMGEVTPHHNDVTIGRGDMDNGDLGCGDIGHGDIGHGDIGHGDIGHGDIGHGDIGHGDIGHGDTLLSTHDMQSVRMNFVKRFIPGATLEEVRGREERYLLPLVQSRPLVMKELFECLDHRLKDLALQSYGLSACTMEEIFVRLTEKELADKTEDDDQLQSSVSDNDTTDTSNDAHQPDVECGVNSSSSTADTPASLEPALLWLACYQYGALLLKRTRYSCRKPAAMLVQLLAPLVIIIMSLLISKYNQSIAEPQKLVMQPSLFFGANHYNYMFLGGINHSAPSYANSLLRPCGLSAEILANSTDPLSPCYTGREPDHCTNYPVYRQPINSCSCDCSWAPPVTQPVCYNGTVTGSRIQNLMLQYNSSLSSVAQSNEAYDMLSGYMLSTKSSYFDMRFGGVSFGSNRSEVSPLVDLMYAADRNHSLPFLAVNEAAKVWYSFKGFHAMPVYLNVINNAILRAHLPSDDADPTTYGIQVSSHPFSTTKLQKLRISIEANFVTVPLGVMFAVGILAAGFTLFLIEERSSGLFHLQIIAGLHRVVYWLSTFTWDLILFKLVTGIVMALFWGFNDLTFPTDVLGPTALLLVCYGLAITPWMYLLSRMFRSPTVAFVMLFCLNFFLGLTLFIIDIIPIIIAAQSDDDNDNPKKVNIIILCIPVPSYPLFRGLLYFTLERPFEVLIAAEVFRPLSDPYEKVYQYMVALLGHALAACSLLVVVEVVTMFRSKYFRRCTTSANTSANSCTATQLSGDCEVEAERVRVLDQSGQDVPVLMKGLCKNHHSVNVTQCKRVCCQLRFTSNNAVNELCLGLHTGECFGLLGLNGAGKTTTFRMLTGDTAPSSGDAFIGGRSVCKNGIIPGSVGYCPQVDAVCGALTGREHLQLFCMLRGVPRHQLSTTVQQSLKALDLTRYADKPVRTYSGGNCRRLSAAIALLTGPPVVLLDEPTSGVDPRARQFLWQVVQGLVSRGQTVILTTHSMAECEALCSRLGIMVNGSLQCLGTPQQLKTRYGQGYRLKIRLGNATTTQVCEFVQQQLLGAVLKEKHGSYLVFQLPVGMPLGSAFSVMEEGRRQIDIDDYSLSQTSLDDVFVHFAKEQGDSREEEEEEEERDPDVGPGVLPDVVPHSNLVGPHDTITSL